MLVYGNPVTDWLAAFAVFLALYTVTMVAAWAGLKAADRNRDDRKDGDDAGL